QPGIGRAEHLDRVTVPMLFLQGTRDTFAQLPLLEPVIARLKPRATLHLIDGGDHSFKVPKSSGRTPEDVMNDLADTIAGWTSDV
ncbi:MAG: alpha/beta hydrolase, partial [Gemmatimonadetes bacterium]